MSIKKYKTKIYQFYLDSNCDEIIVKAKGLREAKEKAFEKYKKQLKQEHISLDDWEYG